MQRAPGVTMSPWGGGKAGSYMVTEPTGLLAAISVAPHQSLQDWGATEYVPMSHFPAESFSSSSLSGSHKPRAREPRLGHQGPHRGFGDSWGLAGTPPGLQPP